jgi:Membrane bound beta barrel domain (DUF5777)
MTSRQAFLSLALCLLAANAFAQNPYAPVPVLPLGDSLLNLPTAHIPEDSPWEIRFTHRFSQVADKGSFSDRLHSLFGLDSSADIGLGVAWAPRRDTQLAIYRSNVLDDIEASVKFVGFEQARRLPLSIALRGGADWRTEKAVLDRYSLFAQAIISRKFGKRVEIFIVPTYVTNAGREPSGSGALFRRAGNVPAGFAVMVAEGLSVVGEFIPKNRDLPASIKTDFGWSLGIKRAIGGHSFEILVTDLPATHVDQYATTTYQGSGVRRGDLHLGFNIERRFGKRHN